MSSMIVSTILSAVLQLIIVFIAIMAFASMKQQYLDNAFRDRAMEVCNELKLLSVFEGEGMLEFSLYDSSSSLKGYTIHFGDGNVTVHWKKDYVCSIPWLHGEGSASAISPFQLEWHEGVAYAGKGGNG